MSRMEVNQSTAKASLTQMLNVVFQRMEAGSEQVTCGNRERPSQPGLEALRSEALGKQWQMPAHMPERCSRHLQIIKAVADDHRHSLRHTQTGFCQQFPLLLDF